MEFNSELGSASKIADRIKDVPYSNKLVIFTSFYEGRAYAGYVHSLAVAAMVLERIGVKWDYWPSSGDFHVENAINLNMTKFCDSDEYGPNDDFLMIDADEAWSADGLMLTLLHDEEIVSGAYCMKNNWKISTAKIKVDERGVPMGKVTKFNRPLLEADRVPGGFLRIKKKALLKYRESFPDRWYWEDNREMKGQVKTCVRMKVCQFFLRSLRDGCLFSQDFNFSEDMKSIGYTLWVEPNVTIEHFGLVGHVFNLDQYLKQVKEEQKGNEAFSTVKKMAEEIKERSAA